MADRRTWSHAAQLVDIHLHRARLFRDKASLAEARKLIEQCGYHRRDEELADAAPKKRRRIGSR